MLKLAGRSGVRALRRAIEKANGRSESPGETLTGELIHRLCVEPPELQAVAWSEEGRHRLDFAWREKKMALEFDGKVKFFNYKPTEQVIYRERQREMALTEEGWPIIRIKWEHLFQVHEFKMRVLRVLRNAG